MSYRDDAVADIVKSDHLWKILDQDSTSSGYYQSANATLTVKLFLETGEGRVDCHPKATEEYVQQAKKKLSKKGYEGPIVVADDGDEAEVENQCTVEQITSNYAKRCLARLEIRVVLG